MARTCKIPNLLTTEKTEISIARSMCSHQFWLRANYLLGENAINGATMKDAIYGISYVGFTGASDFVEYLKSGIASLFLFKGLSTLIKRLISNLIRSIQS